MQDFEFAKDKVLMGAERRSMIISEEEKRVTAIHEAGHALLTVMLPHADPIHKVTIIPRGMALGLTQQLPMDEKHNYSREYLEDQIAILCGGRIAEEVTIGSITTGAGNDLERATDLARRMVCEWGMSGTMGPLTFGKKEEQIFLGRDRAAPGLQRRHSAAHRPGSEALRHRQLRPRDDAHHRAQVEDSGHGRCASRPRDARRRSGEADLRGLPLDELAAATGSSTPTAPREAKPAKERPAAGIVPAIPPRPVTQE